MDQKKRGGPKTAPPPHCRLSWIAGAQAALSPAFLRRRAKTAAAPRPNRTVIGGAGTWVPDELPCEELPQ